MAGDGTIRGGEAAGGVVGGMAGPAGAAEFFAPLLESDDYAADPAGFVLEVRRVLEAQAGWLAALRADETAIRALDQDLLDMESAFEAGRRVDLPDAGFHRHVAEASGNPLLARVILGIFSVLDRAIEAGRQEMVRDHAKQRAFIEQHREILEGIRARDPERARQAMYVHLALVEREAGGS